MAGTGVLARMFQEGAKWVPSHRTGNLLQELETRQLTEEEEQIIQNRVELQRRMLAAFEQQEKARKREQLREVHPDLTDEEADRALQMCDGREDEAAERLACNPRFLRTIQICPVQEVPPVQTRPVAKRRPPCRPAAQRADDQVFVGVFRSRSLMPDTEEEPVLSSDDAAEPLFDTFRNAPRHPRSKTRQKRRRIAVPIETSTDTRHMQANDAADGGTSLRAPSDDSAELTTLDAKRLQVVESREQEAESPLKDNKDDQMVAKVAGLGPAKGADYLKSVPQATAQRVLGIMQARYPSKAGEFWKRWRHISETPRKVDGGQGHEKSEATSSRPKRKAAMDAVGFSQAVLIKSDSETETDEEMYGDHLAKRARHMPARPSSAANVEGLLEEDMHVEGSEGGQNTQKINISRKGSAGNTHRQPLAPMNARPKGARAISLRGHTNRGRVRQKSHKSAELVTAGQLRLETGWHNQGYIFPDGFKSRVNFRSSVELDQLCVHECSVLGSDGEFWPLPTFKVVAMDRPEVPLIAKSCTGCWTGILKRINGEIEARRTAGENLPPPPKTAIAGPEYFGFNQQEVADAIEALDPEHLCDMYWQGKTDRQNHAKGLPIDGQPLLVGKHYNKSRPMKARKPKPRDASSEDDSADEGTGRHADDSTNLSSKWSAISRHERYKQRCGGELEDKGNPLPGWMDPVTLQPVVTPAISPFGHIMGMATWKAVLSESGKCPFTQRPLKAEQCHVLTKINIKRFASRIIADKETLQKYGLYRAEIDPEISQ